MTGTEEEEPVDPQVGSDARVPPGEPLAEVRLRTDARYLDPDFRGEVITPYELCVRPLWPLPYRPKHPRMEPNHRVRGWWDRHRWEQRELVEPLHRGKR